MLRRYNCVSFLADTWPPWLLSSGCFAATIARLFSGGYLATVVPLYRMLCHCCHIGFLGGCLAAEPFGTFPGGYFATAVVGSSPRCHHGFTAL